MCQLRKNESSVLKYPVSLCDVSVKIEIFRLLLSYLAYCKFVHKLFCKAQVKGTLTE